MYRSEARCGTAGTPIPMPKVSQPAADAAAVHPNRTIGRRALPERLGLESIQQ